MTLNRLIKVLQKLAKNDGRSEVVVDKPSLWDGNGTFDICSIKSAKVEMVTEVDGDGCAVENKDGSTRERRKVVLQG